MTNLITDDFLYTNKFAISIIKIVNKLLNLLAKAFVTSLVIYFQFLFTEIANLFTYRILYNYGNFLGPGFVSTSSDLSSSNVTEGRLQK